MRVPEANDACLLQGEWFFGAGRAIYTLLGSCVAVTVWHPSRRIGGMCHFVLPNGPRSQIDMNPRYADGALRALATEIQRVGLINSEFEVGLFGGGNMFSNSEFGAYDIGKRNVDAGRRILLASEFRIAREQTGGKVYRQVHLDLTTGHILVREETTTKRAETSLV